MQGRVRCFNRSKAFGFLGVAAAGFFEDYFFHQSSVIGEFPAAGDEVKFWLGDGPRGGLVAVEVQKVQAAAE
jgi:cold shock CspA family protein